VVDEHNGRYDSEKFEDMQYSDQPEDIEDERGFEPAETGSNRKKSFIIIGVVILLVAALGVSSFYGVFDGLMGDDPDPVAENGVPENGEVVATVNGEEIYEDELNMMVEQELQQEMQQLQMQGIEMPEEDMAQRREALKRQSMEILIVLTLLSQKVEEEGITADEAEVDTEYDQMAEQFGGEEMLEQQMDMAGSSPGELRDEIADSLAIQEYFESYMEEQEEEIDFTEEELREVYRQFEGQIEEDFEEVKPDLKMILMEEKLIEDLKEEAEIEIYI